MSDKIDLFGSLEQRLSVDFWMGTENNKTLPTKRKLQFADRYGKTEQKTRTQEGDPIFLDAKLRWGRGEVQCLPIRPL
jgi:hypothetical protein